MINQDGKDGEIWQG